MAVYNDFECLAHGIFESNTGKCPSGCGASMVKLIFLQAPEFIGAKTKFIDRKTRDIARQFGDTEFNARHDTHRIDMEQTDDIQKKRMRGQTYALPVDSAQGATPYLGMTGGGGDISSASQAKQSANEGLRQTVIARNDFNKTTL